LVLSKLPKHTYSSKNFRLFYIAGDSDKLRVSLSKKNFKLAVDRNKIKRRIKEVFRTNGLYKEEGCFVLMVYKQFKELKYDEATVEIIKAVKLANNLIRA